MACMPRHILGVWADTNTNKSSFTDQVDMTDIWQEYTCHMSASASAARLRARRVSQALFCRCTPASLVDLLRFSNRETGKTWLGPSKAPQPSVDLIHIAQYHQQTGSLYSTYELLALLRLLDLWLTYRPVKHAVTKVTYESEVMIFLWTTYSAYDLLCKSCSLYHS